jgi:hypothetical protein
LISSEARNFKDFSVFDLEVDEKQRNSLNKFFFIKGISALRRRCENFSPKNFRGVAQPG